MSQNQTFGLDFRQCSPVIRSDFEGAGWLCRVTRPILTFNLAVVSSVKIQDQSLARTRPTSPEGVMVPFVKECLHPLRN